MTADIKQLYQWRLDTIEQTSLIISLVHREPIYLNIFLDFVKWQELAITKKLSNHLPTIERITPIQEELLLDVLI